MSISQNRLSHDRAVLSYLDALDAGDLEAIAAAWERASADPVLAALLGEVDQELAAESGNLDRGKLERADSFRRRRTAETRFASRRRWRRTAGIVCALAAACLITLLAWKGLPANRDLKGENKSPPTASMGSSDDAVESLPLVVRSNTPRAVTQFTWPVEERLPLRVGSAVPPDLLN
jgi:hypothetical protein